MKPKAVRCSKYIDGPKINAAGNVAWRRQCQKMTTHPSGRCRFHPSGQLSDDREPSWVGERTVDREARQQRRKQLFSDAIEGDPGEQGEIEQRWPR